MSKRERLLAIIVALLVGLFSLRAVHNKVRTSIDKEVRLAGSLQQQVRQERRELEKATDAQTQILEWRQQSLPPQSDIARSTYKSWLVKKLQDNNWDNIIVQTRATSQAQMNNYQTVTASVTGVATLEGLTTFLSEFYSAPFLHKIRSLTIMPSSDGRELTISFAIEALSFSDSFAVNSLPTTEPNAKREERIAAIRQQILDRNIFVAYTPPPPPRQPRVVKSDPKPPPTRPDPTPPPKFDDATRAYLTATVEIDGKWQAWIDVRTTGERHFLSAGDSFKIGQMEGTVLNVDSRGLLFKCEGEEMMVKLGTSLREADSLTSHAAKM